MDPPTSPVKTPDLLRMWHVRHDKAPSRSVIAGTWSMPEEGLLLCTITRDAIVILLLMP